MYTEVFPLVTPPRTAYRAYLSNGNLTGRVRVFSKPIHSSIVPSAANVLCVLFMAREISSFVSVRANS